MLLRPLKSIGISESSIARWESHVVVYPCHCRYKAYSWTSPIIPAMLNSALSNFQYPGVRANQHKKELNVSNSIGFSTFIAFEDIIVGPRISYEVLFCLSKTDYGLNK